MRDSVASQYNVWEEERNGSPNAKAPQNLQRNGSFINLGAYLEHVDKKLQENVGRR